MTQNQVGYNTFYFSWHDAMDELTLEQYGRVSKAINDYCFYGKHPDLAEFSAIEKSIYKMSVPNVDSSNAAKVDGKRGGEKSRGGGAPSGNQNARKQPKTTPPLLFFNNTPCEKTTSKGEGEGEGEGNGEEICGPFEPPFVETPEKTKPVKGPPDKKAVGKPKKPPLREREPENDHERVEKAYLENWDRLRAEGKVQTPDPVVNWGKQENFCPPISRGCRPTKSSRR